MPITDEDRTRRQRFAAYFEKAVRAAGYVRPSGDLDVPALSRMSGVADNILRRWLNADGDPSLANLRQVAPALAIEVRDLIVAAEQMTPEEAGLVDPPAPPPMPPTVEDRIMADDVLSEDEKAALIQTYRVLRERNSSPGQPRSRRRA